MTSVPFAFMLPFAPDELRPSGSESGLILLASKLQPVVNICILYTEFWERPLS